MTFTSQVNLILTDMQNTAVIWTQLNVVTLISQPLLQIKQEKQTLII